MKVSTNKTITAKVRFFTDGLPKRHAWEQTMEIYIEANDRHRIRHVGGGRDDMIHSFDDIGAAIKKALRRAKVKLVREAP